MDNNPQLEINRIMKLIDSLKMRTVNNGNTPAEAYEAQKKIGELSARLKTLNVSAVALKVTKHQYTALNDGVTGRIVNLTLIKMCQICGFLPDDNLGGGVDNLWRLAIDKQYCFVWSSKNVKDVYFFQGPTELFEQLFGKENVLTGVS